MERFISENFHDDIEYWELLDTTTGDAIPRSQFSQKNLAKEKYYPKGIAFLQKIQGFIFKYDKFGLSLLASKLEM